MLRSPAEPLALGCALAPPSAYLAAYAQGSTPSWREDPDASPSAGTPERARSAQADEPGRPSGSVIELDIA